MIIIYVVVMARRRVHCKKYFLSFSYFVTYCTRQRTITTLSLNACRNKMQQELSYLLTTCIELAQNNLMLTQYKQVEAKISANNQKQKLQVLTVPGYISVHICFNSNILGSFHLLGTRLSFAIDLFANFLFQTLRYF